MAAQFRAIYLSSMMKQSNASEDILVTGSVLLSRVPRVRRSFANHGEAPMERA